MVQVMYREGEGWSVAALEEFSIKGVQPMVQDDINSSKEEDEYFQWEFTVEHFPEAKSTVITYFNSDGEGRNWIGSTECFVEA